MLEIKSELVNNDWERIYINDKLVCENHHVTARGLMRVLESLDLADVKFTEVEEDE